MDISSDSGDRISTDTEHFLYQGWIQKFLMGLLRACGLGTASDGLITVGLVSSCKISKTARVWYFCMFSFEWDRISQLLFAYYYHS